MKNIQLHATGKWVVDTPYVINPNATYTAVSLTTLVEAQSIYGDVYQRVYAPFNVSVERYRSDVENLVTLVTLVSSSEPELLIPDSFISGFPEVTAVPYSHIVLSVSLGGIAETVPLNELKVAISELVFANLGINSVVKEHQSGFVTEWIDYNQHKLIEANRMSIMNNNNGIYSEKRRLENELLELTRKYEILEQLVVSEGLV